MPYHPHRRINKTVHRTLDLIVSAIAVVSPIFTLPQVYLIYSTHSSQGVSVFSWIAYTLTSGVWLYYGLVHREKPIIINSVLGGLLSLAVVFGAIIF
jgi:uncharacterized protein with PQ loop repeat